MSKGEDKNTHISRARRIAECKINRERDVIVAVRDTGAVTCNSRISNKYLIARPNTVAVTHIRRAQ